MMTFVSGTFMSQHGWQERLTLSEMYFFFSVEPLVNYIKETFLLGLSLS